MKPRLLFFCFLLALSACNETFPLEPTHQVRTLPPIPDGIDLDSVGFFTDEPCGPPCLWGIYPGVTTGDQALKIVTEYLPEDHCELVYRENSKYNFISCDQGVGLNVDTANGIVQIISVIPSHSFAVSDVIDTFGEPAYVLVQISGVSDITTDLVLVYPDRQFGVQTERQEGYSFLLQPTTQIVNIIYFSESELETLNFIEEWKGYEKY